MNSRLPRITLFAALAAGALSGASASSAQAQSHKKSAAQPPPAAPAAPTPQGAGSTDELIAHLRVPGGLTSEGAAARARGVSPRNAEGRANTEAAEAQASQAKLGWVPRVRATAQYARLSDVDQPDLGFPVTTLRNQYSNSASIEVPLSDYALRVPNQIASARHGAESARHSERATTLQVEADARVAYFEWVRARLQVVTAQQGLALVDESLATTATQVQAGTASRADLLRLESRRADAELTLRRATDAAAFNEDRLRTLIGATDGETLAVGDDITQVDPAALAEVHASEPAVRWRGAAGDRAEIKALREAELSAESDAKTAIADYLPRLSAFGEVAYDNPNSRVFPPEDKFTSSWTAGLQLTWDLNTALAAPTTREQAFARARARQAQAGQQAEQVRADVLAARQAVDQAQVAIQVGERGLAAAEESHRVRRALQGAGRATAVEVIDSETELTRARVTLVDARIDLHVALVRWRLAVGR
ncbi:MAG TPA: TolC family protein [Kofleriaceae bacterium]|nr:TolC family protein [Kofleriaceae bacterium]